MEFYIGNANGNCSGLKYYSKEEFLEEIKAMIDSCANNGGTHFDISFEADAECFTHWYNA